MIPVNIMGLKPPNDTQLLARIVLLCNVEVELVQLLLQNNYNPNYPQNCSDIISVTIDGRTTSVDMSPLHLAMYEGQKDITELLLKYGAEVNRQTKLGKTALHMASMFGHTDALELLLQHGCDIDAVDCGNNTALAYAINGQHPSTTKLLIEGGASLENINDNDASFLDMVLFFN
ncbi:hypothetical protein LSH36_481g01031 [Paralvinella palmiformis]|uniref:Uncharacterized protein n=1 Tax=Paralvinella palmiformis TaxID=53620 RepID=A0AAD9MZK2_9ANNE|nr:hypothetical protein LSH36_481g01031 [Paralvinella palmiformis]